MQFNEKLKYLRAEKGISQAELAKQIFVSRSAIAKWENGLGLPSEDSLLQLSKFFDLPISYFQSDPVHEDVIIQKNSTLSKQKIVIIILSVLLCITAIATAIAVPLSTSDRINNSKPVADNVPGFDSTYLPGRGLMFENEISLTKDFEGYLDDNISPDKFFPDRRVYILPNDTKSVMLPKIRMEVCKKEDNSSIFGDIEFSNVKLYTTAGLSAYIENKRIHVYLTDYCMEEYEGCVNVNYAGENLSVKIVKYPVPVESVKVRFENDGNQIGLTEYGYVYVDVYPFNASYQDFSLTVNKIERPDGSFLTENLSQYAHLNNVNFTGGELYAESSLEIGSKIHISATTVKDNVTSDALIVEVKRIPIQWMQFSMETFRNSITAGDSQNIKLQIYPANATANVLNEQIEVTLLTEDLATLTYSNGRWIMTASSEYSAVGQEIKVKLSAPEGVEDTFSWFIDRVPIESMTVIDTRTNSELEETTYLHRGDTLQLDTIILPKNASVGPLTYHSTSKNTSNIGAYISFDNGLLTVSEKIPLNSEITISISTKGGRTKNHKIIILPREVESITLSCDVHEVEKGEMYLITRNVNPEVSDIISTRWEFVQSAEGVYLSENMFYIAEDAQSGATFSIVCYINGMRSNVLEFTVI